MTLRPTNRPPGMYVYFCIESVVSSWPYRHKVQNKPRSINAPYAPYAPYRVQNQCYREHAECSQYVAGWTQCHTVQLLCRCVTCYTKLMHPTSSTQSFRRSSILMLSSSSSSSTDVSTLYSWYSVPRLPRD